MKKVHLELLLGRKVYDSEGVRVGRIFSVTAEREGDDCVVREYHLGTGALLARLGIPIRQDPIRVPWDQLDLSNPEKPRLRCRAEELTGRRF